MRARFNAAPETIRVRFDANVDHDLPWTFAPVQRVIEVKIGETFASVDELEEVVRAAYVSYARYWLDAFRRFTELLPADKEDIRLMGTSGTVTTLASVHLALPSYDRRAVDGVGLHPRTVECQTPTVCG